MDEKEMRNFVLRDKDGKEIEVFTGKHPRQAALKAANRGYTPISSCVNAVPRRYMCLQERGYRLTSPRTRLHGCRTRSGSQR